MWTVPRRLLNKVNGKHYKNKVKGQWEKDDNTIIILTLITKTFPLELNKFMFVRCFFPALLYPFLKATLCTYDENMVHQMTIMVSALHTYNDNKLLLFCYSKRIASEHIDKWFNSISAAKRVRHAGSEDS